MHKDDDLGPPEPAMGRPPLAKVHDRSIQVRKSVRANLERTRISELTEVTKPFNAAEFQRVIDELGVARTEVGNWLGLSRRQGERMSSGHRDVPLMLTKLLTLMLRLGLKPEQV